MDGIPVLLILSVLLSLAAIKRVHIILELCDDLVNFFFIHQEYFTVYFNLFGGINVIWAYLSPALSLLPWLRLERIKSNLTHFDSLNERLHSHKNSLLGSHFISCREVCF